MDVNYTKDGKYWVCFCDNPAIAAQGRTFKSMQNNFKATLRAHLWLLRNEKIKWKRGNYVNA